MSQLESAHLNTFQAFLKPRGMQATRILHIHGTKGRVVAIAERADGSPSLVKWNTPDGDHFNKLRGEIEFYRSAGRRPYIPALRSAEDNFLELEYIDSLPLRRWLIDHSGRYDAALLDRLLAQYVDALNDLSSGQLGPSDLDQDSQVLSSYLGKLLTSGPMDNQVYALNKRITETYRRALMPKAKAYIGAQLLQCRSSTFLTEGHGDLHLNNILVSRDGRLFIVDWENRRPQCSLADGLYSAAMIDRLLKEGGHNSSLLTEHLRRAAFLSNPEVQGAFFSILRLYRTAIASNPRFHGKPDWLSVIQAHTRLALVGMSGRNA